MAHQSGNRANSKPVTELHDTHTEGQAGRAGDGGREKEDPAHEFHEIDLEIPAEGVIEFTTEPMESAEVHEADDIFVAPPNEPEQLVIWPRRHAAASLLTAVVLTINLTAHLHRRHPAESPPVTCGITTISIVFSGQPGTTFQYGRPKMTYTIPSSGSIEILADSGVETYEVNGRSMPLNVWPRDEFAARHVPVPVPEPKKNP